MCTCATALGASANDNAFHPEMLVNAALISPCSTSATSSRPAATDDHGRSDSRRRRGVPKRQELLRRRLRTDVKRPFLRRTPGVLLATNWLKDFFVPPTMIKGGVAASGNPCSLFARAMLQRMKLRPVQQSDLTSRGIPQKLRRWLGILGSPPKAQSVGGAPKWRRKAPWCKPAR